jgi:patatin-like phospholipase/acyl hydrolase
MNADALNFRNQLASEGTELTPEEAEKLYNNFEEFKESVRQAAKDIPNYYMEICNRTTEEKLADIARYKKAHNEKMTLKEYNNIMKIVKLICEIEGYV